MLQTDQVEDDYFTPTANTSLANIFGNIAQNREEIDREKLKYTPPKPQKIQKEPVPAKATECLFACALIGHEWSNNNYTPRGKLGFAIIKIQKSGDHNIVLYDSDKTALSCTTVSPKLEISVKNNCYISYYDNFQKYWSIYAAEDDAKKIIETLIKFEVIIKQSANTIEQTGPPEPKEQELSLPIENVESDTDSSLNRKTKASILNRMANMGHSVFPTNTITADRTSDSSDTNEAVSHLKIVRHKPMKSSMKRHNTEVTSQSEQSITDTYYKRNIIKTEQNTDNAVVQTSASRQLIPINSTNFTSGSNISCTNEMSLFMSEQRISNSELRINMNRISDKVDSVLDKVNTFNHRGENVQTEILLKLLAEYENKIKVYEELLKTNNVNLTKSMSSTIENETEILRNMIQKLEQTNKDQCHEIVLLKDEIENLKQKCAEAKDSQIDNENVHKELGDLELRLALKNQELMTLSEKYDSLSSNTNANEQNMESKLKNIMNDTFQTIAANFENGDVYSGETVKKIIAAVIKKITIETLKKL